LKRKLSFSINEIKEILYHSFSKRQMFSYKIRKVFLYNTISHIDSRISLMKYNLTFNQKSSFYVLPSGNTVPLKNKKLANTETSFGILI